MIPDIVDWVVDASASPQIPPSSTDQPSDHILPRLGLHIQRSPRVPRASPSRGHIANWVILGSVVESFEDDRFHVLGCTRVHPVSLVKPDINIPFEIMPNTQNFGFDLHFPLRKAKRIFEIFFTKIFRKDLNDFIFFLLNMKMTAAYRSIVHNPQFV